MARCGCTGQSCSCLVQGSGAITVTGSGSALNPYVVSGGAAIAVLDSSTIDLTLSGDGSGSSPYSLRADATITLGELEGVSVTGSTGYVLAKQSDGTFALVPPATAAPGTIFVGNGLDGDGTSGDPINLVLASNSGLTVDAGGLKANTVITDTGVVSSGVLTASSGWSITEGKGRRWGPVVHLQIVAQRTGATVNSNGSGNITNLGIATAAIGWRPSANMHAGWVNSFGGILWGGFISPSGVVAVGALPPNVPINTGDTLFGSATFLTEDAI